MKEICYTFKRTEKKYLLNEVQYQNCIDQVKKHMQPDEYGNYSIYNVYYDTVNYALIRNSIEKPVFKEKLRMRSYCLPKDDSTVFLEIKRKVNGIVFKRRVTMNFCDAKRYIETGLRDGYSGQVFNEIDYFLKYYHPAEKLFLRYDREAYKGVEDETLRITFDKDIRSRETDVYAYNDSGDNLLKDGQRLMEIKANSAIPLWLCKALTDNRIYPCSFSKYGTVYKNKIIEGKGA